MEGRCVYTYKRASAIIKRTSANTLAQPWQVYTWAMWLRNTEILVMTWISCSCFFPHARSFWHGREVKVLMNQVLKGDQQTSSAGKEADIDVMVMELVPLTQSRRYAWSGGNLRSRFPLPLTSSRATIPKLKTSAFSVSWPRMAYSGAR